MPVMNACDDFFPRGKGNDEAVTLQRETVPCAELVSFCEEVSLSVDGVLQGHRQVDVFLRALPDKLQSLIRRWS